MNMSCFSQQHEHSKTIQFYCMNIINVYSLISLVHNIANSAFSKIAILHIGEVFIINIPEFKRKFKFCFRKYFAQAQPSSYFSPLFCIVKFYFDRTSVICLVEDYNFNLFYSLAHACTLL